MSGNDYDMVGEKGCRKTKDKPWDVNRGNRGGTVLAIAGDDFVVVASDTRLSSPLFVSCREQSKIFAMTPYAAVACTGCWSDTNSLVGLLRMNVRMYELEQKKVIATEALAQLISTVMYNRRFIPYFTYTILAGINRDGRGVVYNFDPLGHLEPCRYIVMGSSEEMLLPIMDMALGWKNQTPFSPGMYPPMTQRRAGAIAHNVLLSASKLDVFTGDSGIIQTITMQGVTSHTVPLAED